MRVEKEPTLDQKKAAARNVAFRRLREAHREDWNRLLKAEFEKVGVEWTPPPTEEEKAQQTIVELLEKFPTLRRSWLPSKGSPELSPPDPDSLPEEPKLPADPVLGRDGPDPAEDTTRNDYA